jgi:hypothetical protein
LGDVPRFVAQRTEAENMSRIQIRSSRSLLIVAVALVAVLTATTSVVAMHVNRNGRAVTAVRTATSDETSLTMSTTFVDVPWMTTTVAVPKDQRALLVITFSAETKCVDPSEPFTNACFVRVLVDEQEAEPGFIYFDSAADENSAAEIESNSIQWIAPVAGGDHSVKVQYMVLQGDSRFYLSARTLTILRSRV